MTSMREGRSASRSAARSAASRKTRGGRKRLVEQLHGAVDLVAGDVERGRHAHDVAVETALADQETALARLLEEARDRVLGRSLRLAVLDELERLHEAHAAHVA